LEQDFNSLDAQHEACAAYIKSQASEGWKLVAKRYDDGGISGGTLERSGLKRLLADIAAGHVDIVVVYKVDRLTRSLLDFAKLVEAFDKADTSFVSITQSFNTTTSMGRLTLNMLLSFAQFEREVTAERIRDKIAQSKARGMWMGGTPPIGYRPDGRSLAIVEQDAAIVRRIFGRYAELANVRLLAAELDEQGIRSPARITTTGRAFGDRPFSRGQLYKILSNPTYVARIDHGGRSHAANFSPIIEQALWDDVQTKLAANVNGTRSPAPAEASLLAGKLVDDRGVPMIAVHACKGKVRYRYYVSRDLQHGGDASKADGWRLPAREIEPLVRVKVAALLNDPIELLARSGTEMSSPDEFKAIMARGKKAATKLAGPRAPAAKLLRALVAEVRLEMGQVGIELNTAKLASLFEISLLSEDVKIDVAVRLKRSGMVMRLVTHDGSAAAPTVDRTLVKAIVQGRSWWQELQTNTSMSLEDIARREGITAAYVVRIVRLAFLSPRMLKSIIEGTLPTHLTIKRLTMPDAISARWDHQFV
ncbi:MAG TPA: recombinase family protein, partial [Sphingomicrobium sp.]|nr:recombinase family protein [Sphingomicrobium sp.]